MRQTGKFLGLAILVVWCGLARADDASVTTISPIFSELVASSLPAGFATVDENASGNSYIREAVPKGEDVNHWTQMITITGVKDIAGNPDVTPESAANVIGNGYHKACPDTFGAIYIDQIHLGGHDARIVFLSCGMAPSMGEPRSESVLLIVVKGTKDYYTIQWAERGAASKTAVAFDNNKWLGRFKSLQPIKFCPIVSGEKAPYPSCLKR